MRTFEQLTEQQQTAAVQYALNSLMRDLLEHGVRFNDASNGNDLQARIDAAIELADSRMTPWFANDYIMDTCRDDLMVIVQATAKGSLYAEPGEYVVHGIITEEKYFHVDICDEYRLNDDAVLHSACDKDRDVILHMFDLMEEFDITEPLWATITEEETK